MSSEHEDPELLPELDAAEGVRAAFAWRDSTSKDSRRAPETRGAEAEERRGYEQHEEIARGGMGVIVKAFDRGLERDVALKVLRDELAGEPRYLQRFMEEARVTARLDHPGIVPVHEVGRHADGRAYFAMRLVRGRDLKQIIDLANRNREGWSQARCLTVILKVCEAMAYAHDKGVLHRDLKPANVMVGAFGEVYVMDWGLALEIGQADTHDLRLRGESGVESESRANQRPDADSPIVTMDGEVLGTPCYMPPEQASGRMAEVGPRSDIYSVGAMLYHLLGGEMPYVAPGTSVPSRTVLRHVIQGPPRPLHELHADLPAELIAISEKAMAREPERRYASMLAMAEDLRAFLEGRVVRAYQTGAFAEFRKWMQRNKGLSAASAAAVLALVLGLVASLVLKSQSDRNAELAQENATVAKKHEENATARADDVFRLSALQDLEDLNAEANELWPADPGMVARYDAWIARARKLVGELPEHEAKLSELRARALPRNVEKSAPARADLPRSTERGNPAGEIEAEASTASEWSFADTADKWWHNQLTKLIESLTALVEPAQGLLSPTGLSPKYGWSVAKRREFAGTIEERSVSGPQALAKWSEALASIRDERTCPLYRGLVITPQLGLLPLGRDPDSGLWEFAQLETGEPPERGTDGKLVLRAEMGLVFVLLPGGVFHMGAQRVDPTGPNFDPQAMDSESPVHEVAMSPYFLSKYEMTQAQWERFTGKNPSLHGPENYLHFNAWSRRRTGWSGLHPVEEVTWFDCCQTLKRVNLVLPTEDQWEYACRAGTSSVFWTGDEPESLSGTVNLADSYAKQHGYIGWQSWEAWLDDGETLHSEVGAYRPNAFGLHDMHGNVWEWCRNSIFDYAKRPPTEGDALAVGLNHVLRGGGFAGLATQARCAIRGEIASAFATSDSTGLRPARILSR